VKSLLGQALFTASSTEQDLNDAADLVFSLGGRSDTAVRIRKPDYFEKYQFEVTLRSGNNGCAKTEIDKIIDGKGDWMFYGFGAEDGCNMKAWSVLDLDAFRAAMIRRKLTPVAKRNNRDRTLFDAFDLRQMLDKEPRIIVASSFEALKPKRKVA
jgi:hypothetical protein